MSVRFCFHHVGTTSFTNQELASPSLMLYDQSSRTDWCFLANLRDHRAGQVQESAVHVYPGEEFKPLLLDRFFFGRYFPSFLVAAIDSPFSAPSPMTVSSLMPTAHYVHATDKHRR